MSFKINDSGQRERFASGMHRDVTEGKTDYSLIFDGPMLERWAEHLTKGAKKYTIYLTFQEAVRQCACENPIVIRGVRPNAIQSAQPLLLANVVAAMRKALENETLSLRNGNVTIADGGLIVTVLESEPGIRPTRTLDDIARITWRDLVSESKTSRQTATYAEVREETEVWPLITVTRRALLEAFSANNAISPWVTLTTARNYLSGHTNICPIRHYTLSDSVDKPFVIPGKRNWMKAMGQEELERFRESAARHFVQWMHGDEDEDHAAAVLFNINGVEYVKYNVLEREETPEDIIAREGTDYAGPRCGESDGELSCVRPFNHIGLHVASGCYPLWAWK